MSLSVMTIVEDSPDAARQPWKCFNCHEWNRILISARTNGEVVRLIIQILGQFCHVPAGHVEVVMSSWVLSSAGQSCMVRASCKARGSGSISDSKSVLAIFVPGTAARDDRK